MGKALAGICLIVLAFTGAVTTRGQELSSSDKERAMQYLEKTKKDIEDATRGLSTAQWNFKAGPDRWCIAQVMEHIAAAEDLIRGMIADQGMKAPAGEPGRDMRKTDDAVVAMIPDRSHKAQAPEPLKPTNRYGSPEEAVKHFLSSRAETEEFLNNTSGLRQHVSDSPMGMKLDCYEWILFLTAHSERHLKQILEVKADPNFPKA
jgi:DinB superfamily